MWDSKEQGACGTHHIFPLYVLLWQNQSRSTGEGSWRWGVGEAAQVRPGTSAASAYQMPAIPSAPPCERDEPENQ